MKNYDHGVKHISKHTGLSGVEASNIVKKLLEQDLEYDLFDWKTIGDNMYGHGKKTKGVLANLKAMYGVSIGSPSREISSEMQRFSDMEVADIMPKLMEIHGKRSPKARMMDLSKAAVRTFKPTNQKGVELWIKNPNRFDIIGIDDKIL